MVPFIDEWMLQWYAYVPGFLIVTVADDPPSMSPVSNAPLFAVNVCVVPSLFVTLTFAPAFTSSVFGENATPLIVTAGLFARDVAAPAATAPRLSASSSAAVSAVRRVRIDRVGVDCM